MTQHKEHKEGLVRVFKTNVNHFITHRQKVVEHKMMIQMDVDTMYINNKNIKCFNARMDFCG